MLEYQDKVVQDVAACTCDRCQRRMTPDNLDWHEKLSIAYRGGFDSIFGDGCAIEIDLCQQCVKETLGAWLRVTPPDTSWLRSSVLAAATALETDPERALNQVRAYRGAIREYPDDIRKMRISLGEQERAYTDGDLAYAWLSYSGSLCASWLSLPDDAGELATRLRHYLPSV